MKKEMIKKLMDWWLSLDVIKFDKQAKMCFLISRSPFNFGAAKRPTIGLLGLYIACVPDHCHCQMSFRVVHYATMKSLVQARLYRVLFT